MKGLFIPEITAEMFRNGCLEGIEALMAEGEIYDIDYTGWIPCSERLPEKFYVLCCDNHGEMLIANPFECDDSDTGFSAESDECYMYNCIAWMPLPDPYTEMEP